MRSIILIFISLSAILAEKNEINQIPEAADYVPTMQVKPKMYCWSHVEIGWTVYFGYHSIALEDVYIPLGADNIIAPSTSPLQLKRYPGQIETFSPGRHLSFKVENAILSIGTPGFRYRVDGNEITANEGQTSWALQECPSTLSISLPIAVTCPVTDVEASLTQNLLKLIESYKTQTGIQLSVTANVTLETPCDDSSTSVKTNAIAVLTTPDNSSPMQVIFDLIVQKNLSTIVSGTSATYLPKILSDVATVKMPFDLRVGYATNGKPSSQKKDLTVGGTMVSVFSFALVLASIIIVFGSFLATISVCCWGYRAQKKRKATEIV